MKKYLFIFLIVFVMFFTSASQVTGGTAYPDHGFVIEYIKAYYTDSQFENSKNLLTKISDLIFGEKTIRLIKPVNLIITPDNHLLILDQGSKSLVDVDRVNKKFSIFKNRQDRQFPSLVGICLFSEQTVLFTDSAIGKIFKFNSSTSGIDYLQTNISLIKPTGIIYLPAKQEIWVCETGTHRISVFNIQGKFLKSIGKRGTASGEFNFPNFIWLGNDEKIYVNDAMNYRIQVLNREGDVLNVFGQQGDASGYFAAPKGLATDSFGHIYVVDGLFHTVQIFNQMGEFLYSFGKKGHADGEFYLPVGIYIDNKDHIYVADSYNSRIQEFQLKYGEMNGY